MNGAISIWKTRTGLGWALLWFSVGVCIHIFLLRRYVDRALLSDWAVANHPLTHAGIALFGGLYVAWFMVRLLRRTLAGEERTSSRILLRGCLYGVYATTLALQTFYLFASLYFSTKVGPPSLMPLTFLFIFMGVGTYGMGIILQSVPIAAGYGFLGGAFVLLFRRYETSQPVPVSLERQKNLGRDSLLAGAMGTLFSFVPFVGSVLAVFAIVFGISALKRAEETRRGRRLAIVGLILGGVTIARELVAIVLY